jgi:predicted transcriptional regulator
MKPRHDVYLETELSQRLVSLAAKPGASKSGIISAALKAYLDSEGANRLDDLLQTRLTRLGNRLDRIERDQRVVVETLALFIRHFFIVTPALPESEMPAARASGEARYQTFIEQVGRRLAAGRPSAPAPAMAEAAE